MVIYAHSSLGEIAKIQNTDKRYTKIILSVYIPFKTVNITFNVWDIKKLMMKMLDFQLVTVYKQTIITRENSLN